MLLSSVKPTSSVHSKVKSSLSGIMYAPYIPVKIKRIIPTTISNKLVSIQPLSAPSRLLYFCNYEKQNIKIILDRLVDYLTQYLE